MIFRGVLDDELVHCDDLIGVWVDSLRYDAELVLVDVDRGPAMDDVLGIRESSH